EAPRDVHLVHALILFVLALLFLYACRPMELVDNALDYIAKVGRGDLFYPPHLLHSAFIKGFHSVLSSVSSCDVACAGMVHSMLWGAAAVASTYLIARPFMAAGGALLTALAVLVAHGFWVFATQLEVYVPSVGAVTTASAVLFTTRSPRLGWVRVLAVAILWAIATTYHVANVFLFLPFCAYFFGRQGWRGWLQLAIVSVLAGSLVFAAFVVAYLIDNDAWSIGGFFVWVFALTNVPMTEWGSLSHWHPVWLFRAGWRQIIAVTLLPEYLTANQTPLWIIGALVALAALAWNAFQVALPSRPAGVRVYFLLLFATNFLFFAWWQPMVHKFYIPSSVPLIFLTAMAVHDLYLRVGSTSARRVVAGLASAVVAVIFVFNLSSVLELRRSLGPYHAEAAVLDRLTP